MSDYILEMQNITKEFPGVKALSNVNFKVKRGEIHCLVGENGAGKSTLMKILSGVHPFGTYSGNIVYNGQIQQFKSIAESEATGIAIINQELALIPELSVYENIYFGHEIMDGRLINWNKTIISAQEMLKKVRLNINPSMKIKNLSVGNRQLVEIAKAFSKNAELLILDEPTAALNEDDSENLLDLLRELKAQGVTCIMISHKLKEIVSIADTVTVLRDGSTICSMDAHTQDITEQEIIKYMVGREIENIYPKRENIKVGDVCLDIKDWSVYDPVHGREILHDININVRKGEIVGIAGLMGAGRTELALSLFGNVPGYKITRGEMLIDGESKTFKHPKDAMKAGLAYASEDRKKDGLILIQDIKYNTTIANLEKITNGIVINENEEIRISKDFGESINIKAPSIKQKVSNLSGGNQQKVSLAKWLFVEPKVLILDEPTRGIDVGAKFEIYTLMNQLVEQGMSIIMISSELLEVLGMSDRLYVMSHGKITGELSAEEATEQKVMTMATRV
ncbi:MAG: ATP-binding cassette domain-containing protein [Anaerocolumna aminovalerica]|uniref:ATP-binding cassette domain-containing protein n=1 Tax=Anaerocolumna aminovalerica TaxID=1527 RepID=UPI001C0EDF70|nr:ATP-binding cassette domain-containing protein [Anaerocolumna aminovalerica]MBU5332190.1 ATP-binding cassette domain-containing protein [Anaerocolumna aminovalerica]MDU6266716.1 ATP-binding cassette domain-containing protein [Anaerocolumna aminovalerica]